MKTLAVLLLFMAAGCVSSQPYVEVGGARASVEIADSTHEWETGLMFRESLAPDAGMLFIFPDEAPRSFWMRNMLIPLDMLFIDSGGAVVNMTRNAQPCKDIVCESYYGRAKYVLEVNAGFADENGIEIGDRMSYKGK